MRGRSRAGVLWPTSSPVQAGPRISAAADLLLLVVYAGAVVLRMPRILLEGRFWAEEGDIYFRPAWIGPSSQALLAPHQGYYSLLDNLASAVAAHLVPLLYAPLLTIWTGLLVQ